MFWSCSAASGNGKPAFTDPTMNSASYQRASGDNVRPSVQS